MFLYQIEKHMQKLQALLKEKKNYMKKSLTPLLHQAIQLRFLYYLYDQHPGHWRRFKLKWSININRITELNINK